MFIRKTIIKEDNLTPEDIIRAREQKLLEHLLPSGTEVPFRLSDGEENTFIVGRDKRYTYLIMRDCMADPCSMNPEYTNKGGWPACRMRKYVQKKFKMMPAEVKKIAIPMHIRQIAQNEVVECDDVAFLLGGVNVLGEKAWDPGSDCGDTQIDIFHSVNNRIKHMVGTPNAVMWWLRSCYSVNCFSAVITNGTDFCDFAVNDYGVVIAVCIEDRG